MSRKPRRSRKKVNDYFYLNLTSEQCKKVWTEHSKHFEKTTWTNKLCQKVMEVTEKMGPNVDWLALSDQFGIKGAKIQRKYNELQSKKIKINQNESDNKAKTKQENAQTIQLPSISSDERLKNNSETEMSLLSEFFVQNPPVYFDPPTNNVLKPPADFPSVGDHLDDIFPLD